MAPPASAAFGSVCSALVDFSEALAHHGFRMVEERPSQGATVYSSHPNPYLTYWLHAYQDGTALFTWEFAIADYLLERGIQLGSSESLNLFAFPVSDDRGPQDASWLTHALDEAEARLRSIDLAEAAKG